MNREEIEEVLEYLRDTIHLPSQQPEVVLHPATPHPSSRGILLFDEAPTPGARYHLSEGAVTRISDPPPTSTQTGFYPARPITAEAVEEAVESVREGSPMMRLFREGARMILRDQPLVEFIQQITEPPPTSQGIHTVPSSREMFERSSDHRYNTLDEAKHHVHYALKELGEPHLVGLEWEPQATLLNHPNRAVHVVLSSTFPWHTYDRGFDDISINLPRTMTNFVDIRNGALEIRSQAVQPESLHFAINRANTQLETLCKLIAEMYGPCALFLPSNDPEGVSVCTKHYHVSWIINKEETVDRLYDVFNKSACYGRYYPKKGRRHQIRVHINVPYEFTRYSEIKYAWFQAMSDIDYTLPPRLLCYSHTGEDVVSMSKLT